MLQNTRHLRTPSCRQAAAHRITQRRSNLRLRTVPCAVQQFEPEVIPPPPPPPSGGPRQAPQGPDRRQVLGYIAAGVAVVATTAFGVSSFQGQQSSDKLEEMRLKSGFKREKDGHVYLRARDGAWVQLRLDAGVPGTVLMRRPKGEVFFLTINNLQQVDLTDDFVVTVLFSDGSWEAGMQRVQARDEDGAVVDLTLDEDNFNNLISISA